MRTDCPQVVASVLGDWSSDRLAGTHDIDTKKVAVRRVEKDKGMTEKGIYEVVYAQYPEACDNLMAMNDTV